MAEIAVTHPLDESRRRLRSFLIPGGADTDVTFDNDHFPRSKVMRFAFNPRNRQAILLAGSVLAVLATRAVGVNRIGVVTDIARSYSRFRNGRS